MTLRVFMSAGEYSGDLLGKDLILALKATLGEFECFGIVGEEMKSVGAQEVAHISELSMMGFWEVLKSIGSIVQLEKKVIAAVDELKPDVAILIDFPGLHFRFAEAFHLRGIKVVQYVAPKVWAWGRHRLENLRRDFSLVLGVLPFEEDFFHKERVPYAYVGSPHVDRIQTQLARKPTLTLNSQRPIIALLPGSRTSELELNLPAMLEIKKNVDQKIDVQWLMPLAENLSEDFLFTKLPWFKSQLQAHKNLKIVKGQSLEVMRLARAGLVASGTATLECALIPTPLAVLYVLSDFSYNLAKKKVKVPWVSLVNLILQRESVKEYIQEFSPAAVASELIDLVNESQRRNTMLADFRELAALLTSGAAQKSAQMIKNLL